MNRDRDHATRRRCPLPFDLKDALKRRGYRWSDGSDGRPRSWYIGLDESKLEAEIAFLKNEIGGALLPLVLKIRCGERH